jgi:hypothetical protein
VKKDIGLPCVSAAPRDEALPHHEHRIEQLIDHLPDRFRTTIRWLRRPSLRWLRMVAGVLFIAGSFLSILPIFGLWMLPLGLMLLAEDIAPLRRARNRILDWIERHRPHWFTTSDVECRTQSSRPQSSIAGRPSSAGTHH